MTHRRIDNFMIYVPDSDTLPRIAWRHDAIVRAMDELGPKAKVLRITEGELCRDMTHQFEPVEPDEYEDRDWRSDHTRYMALHGAFGRR